MLETKLDVTKLDVKAGSRGSSLKPATAEHLYQPPPASTAPASTGAGDTQRLSAHTQRVLSHAGRGSVGAGSTSRLSVLHPTTTHEVYQPGGGGGGSGGVLDLAAHVSRLQEENEALAHEVCLRSNAAARGPRAARQQI